MSIKHCLAAALAVFGVVTGLASSADGAQRVRLDPSMVVNEAPHGEPQNMVDEQGDPNRPHSGEPQTAWRIPSQYWKTIFPASAYIDLGQERYLSSLWIYDTNGKGNLDISAGSPGNWTKITTYDCGAYKAWVEIPLNVHTRYLRFTRHDGGSNFQEIALYEQTVEEHAAAQAKRIAEERAAAEKAAEEARQKAIRDAAIAKAQQERASRPVIDLGEPFGQVTLIDEIDVAADDPGHLFNEFPEGVSRIETILGKRVRVLSKTENQAAHMTFRIGQYKLLEAGGHYVLEIEYPEDAPRSMVINSSGNEASLGFHTGATVGDAFHPKYVDNLNESITVPLSGEYRTWRMYFNLHDRYPDTEYVRGTQGNRKLTPEDGFTVSIAQFSADNIPISHGAAVSRIRLYQVNDPQRLKAKYTPPPEGLPRRHIFWREEMADMVLHGEKNGTPAGLDSRLDWYRFKANQMDLLAINTYTKDLLEFGAVQHWDTSPYGGNRWAYFNNDHRGLWEQIVQLMGERGFYVLPYYEYAGSKGQQGLGNQRRAKPLTRDDAYTHISWIENSNVDITDPDTYEDFRKMLELTVVQFKDRAPFVGAWLRPRSQIPIGFGDATRKRFANEANNGREVTRQQLQEDPKLYARYKQWWMGKRQQFLVAMRDYLREQGVDDAIILYTTVAGEPGVSFRAIGGPVMVTDDVEGWRQRLAASGHERDAKVRPITVEEIVSQDLYLKAHTSPPSTWGSWEVHHANPEADPENYKQTEGVLLTYAFNRLYTVSSARAFEAFRAASGLAIVRHYSLNENMIYDASDKPALGYFSADVERAGPYCMMGEALAVANGDPRFIGYLRGRVHARGFPEYVRNFNAAFLSLPALPSQRVDGAASDNAVVVRAIPTNGHGTYLAIVNTAMTDRNGVQITLPASGRVTDAVTGEAIQADGGKVTLDFYPYQLRALRVQ